MSWSSGLRTVSSSMAKTWLLALPLSLMFMRPKYCAPVVAERFLLGATRKARPWSLSSACSETMANTKVAEKDTVVAPLFGGEWKRPLRITVAAPSRLRFAPVKPSKANWFSLADGATSLMLWKAVSMRKLEMGLTNAMATVTHEPGHSSENVALQSSGWHHYYDPRIHGIWLSTQNHTVTFLPREY
uniref:Secreted protein n=1 Tax=Leersia perrieri TaxID=77586 RepID=A0A0D9VS41_9ORYZ